MMGFVAFAACSLQATVLAQAPPAQPPDERAKVVQVARTLERDPIGNDAAEQRKWVLTWLIDHSELDFNVCASLLEPLLRSNHRYSSEINLQMIASSGAFVIEHPDKMHDNAAVYLAGLEGSLAVYESIIKTVPNARWKFLDDLVDRRNKGKLPEYIAKEKQGCK
jgi:hypothetical protein